MMTTMEWLSSQNPSQIGDICRNCHSSSVSGPLANKSQQHLIQQAGKVCMEALVAGDQPGKRIFCAGLGSTGNDLKISDKPYIVCLTRTTAHEPSAR